MPDDFETRLEQFCSHEVANAETEDDLQTMLQQLTKEAVITAYLIARLHDGDFWARFDQMLDEITIRSGHSVCDIHAVVGSARRAFDTDVSHITRSNDG